MHDFSSLLIGFVRCECNPGCDDVVFVDATNTASNRGHGQANLQLKKVWDLPAMMRQAWIDKTDAVTMVRQCVLAERRESSLRERIFQANPVPPKSSTFRVTTVSP
jgi:hypothetical protein